MPLESHSRCEVGLRLRIETRKTLFDAPARAYGQKRRVKEEGHATIPLSPASNPRNLVFGKTLRVRVMSCATESSQE